MILKSKIRDLTIHDIKTWYKLLQSVKMIDIYCLYFRVLNILVSKESSDDQYILIVLYIQ